MKNSNQRRGIKSRNKGCFFIEAREFHVHVLSGNALWVKSNSHDFGRGTLSLFSFIDSNYCFLWKLADGYCIIPYAVWLIPSFPLIQHQKQDVNLPLRESFVTGIFSPPGFKTWVLTWPNSSTDTWKRFGNQKLFWERMKSNTDLKCHTKVLFNRSFISK